MKYPVLWLWLCLVSPLCVRAALPLWVIGREGIHALEFDPQSGAMSAPKLAAAFEGASWVAHHPTAPLLYASWGRTGVAVFRITEAHGLKLINQVDLPAGAVAHLAIDSQGSLLATAHYGGGAVTVVPIQTDGTLDASRSVSFKPKFSQAGPRPVQTQSRPHWARFSADGRFLDVTDLGGDRVWAFNVSRAPLGLTVHQVVQFPAGFGPRHMDGSADGIHRYVSGELSSEIAVLDFDQAVHRFDLKQVQPTLGPDDREPANNTSEVRLHPSGRFVYIGNRGHDSIAVFAVEASTGRLTPVEREPVRGIWPRNFDIDPSGQWLVVAGQYSDSLTVFAIDATSGALTFNRQVQTVRSPNRVLFGRVDGAVID